MNGGTRCTLGYDISQANPDEERRRAISLSTIAFAWSPDIRTALGICVAAHLHRNLISNRVWDLVPGSQTKTEEAINAPCSRVHITTMLCSTYIHGDRCALRLKTLTEHFRDENLEFWNFGLEFEF